MKTYNVTLQDRDGNRELTMTIDAETPQDAENLAREYAPSLTVMGAEEFVEDSRRRRKLEGKLEKANQRIQVMQDLISHVVKGGHHIQGLAMKALEQ